jgi:hypothetical protein
MTLSSNVIHKVQSEYFFYGCIFIRNAVNQISLLHMHFGNITDFGAKCEKCETIYG